MGRKYQLQHPEDPYDLSDPKGIAVELADEALEDAKELAGDVAETVTKTASKMAGEAADEAQAAYRYPLSYAGYTLRRLERRARARPLDTLATAGAIAFLFGALFGVRRKATLKGLARRREDALGIAYDTANVASSTWLNTLGGYVMARPYADSNEPPAQSVGAYAERALDDAKNYAISAADKVSAAAREAYEDAPLFIRENRERLTNFTKEKPIEALAIAAGIAFVLGTFWKK